MTESALNNTSISFVETPDEIVKLMVSLISETKLNDLVLDSGCGKGVFLNHLKENNFRNLEGIELDHSLFSTCKDKFPEISLYNTDFLDWEPSREYDVIIGNPPYMHYNSLPEEMRKKVEYIVKSKESDIYYAFILKAIDILKENGELVYIVPYGFFYNTFAKIVREKIISSGYIEVIIDLDEVRLFEGENPETIIFKFIKQKPRKNQKTRVLRLLKKNASPKNIHISAQESISSRKRNVLFEYIEKPIFSSSDEIWSSYPEIEIPMHVKLSEIAWVGVGMVTGFEKAFLITEEEDMLAYSDTEHQGIITAIKAKHCKGYWTEGYSKYILIDYLVESEEQLKKKFPSFYRKMLPFKNSMKNRYLPQSKNWYNWQALRNFEDYNGFISKTKILVPNLDRSKTNRFSISSEEIYPSGDVLTIIPAENNVFFLLGYLNSDFFREYYLSAGARRGHRVAYTQRILSNIRIPTFTKDIKNKISTLAKTITEERDTSARNKIDRIIRDAFHEKLFEKWVTRK